MLLIFVFVLLFCLSLVEEELWGFEKYVDLVDNYIICKKKSDRYNRYIYLNLNKKEGYFILF